MVKRAIFILSGVAALGLALFVNAQEATDWGRGSWADLPAPRTSVKEFPLSDFKSMSDTQAVELAIKKTNDGNRAVGGVSVLNQEECGGPQVQVRRQTPHGEVTENVVICMLDLEKLKTVTQVDASSPSEPISGPGLKVSTKKDAAKDPKITWEFSTGNDANPLKLGTRVSGDGQPGQNLSDDVGRTFDLHASRRKTTNEGYSEIRVDSQNFGSRTTVNGFSEDSVGRPYMKLLNVTSLALAEGTKLRSKDGVTDLRTVEGSVEVSTGKGKTLLGTELQNWFHETTKSGSVYHHVDHERTKVVATLKGGLARIIEGDLAAFRCKLTGTGLVGIGTDGKPVLEGRANAMINTGSLGGRSAENPWIQLDAYRTHLIKQGDRPEEKYGIKISTSVEVGPVRVKPFFSISRNDGSRDRKYAAGSLGGRGENYYGVGIMAEWK